MIMKLNKIKIFYGQLGIQAPLPIHKPPPLSLKLKSENMETQEEEKKTNF